MLFVTTFFVLSITGLIDVAFLLYRHSRGESLICPLDHDCSRVTESKWSVLLGIRNEVLGLLFYGTLLVGIVAAVLWPARTHDIYLLLFFLAIGGFLYSVFLTYLQFFVLHDYCFYCLVSALLTLGILINGAYLFLSGL